MNTGRRYSDSDPLLSFDEEVSYQETSYQRFARFFSSDLSLSALLLKICNVAVMRQNLPGFRFPSANSLGRRLQQLYQNIIDGSNFWLKDVWPSVFLAMLSYDLYNYFHYPDQRDGVTADNILLGIANSQDGPNFSCNLGNNNPASHDYWYGPMALFAAWFLSMLFYMLYRHSWHSITYADKQSNSKLFLRAAAAKLLDDSINEFSVNDDSSSVQTLYQKIKNADKHSFIRAMLLADIVKQLKPATLKKLTLNHADDYGEIQQSALQELKEMAMLSSHLGSFTQIVKAVPLTLYARYQLWSAGGANFSLDHTFYFFVPLVAIYTEVRFFQLLLLKALEYHDLSTRACECFEAGLAWHYTEMAGQYLCSVCGDWDFIELRSINNETACFAGLLEQPLSVRQLTTGLARFNQSSAIQTLDLGVMNWHLLSGTEMQQLVNALTTAIASNLTHISLALPHFVNNVANEVIAPLASLFAASPMQWLSLNNVGLSISQLTMLLSALKTPLHTLLLDNMQLVSAQLSAIFNHTMTAAELSVLSLANNQLDNAAGALLANLSFPYLQQLSLAYNSFSDVADILMAFPLQAMNISGNPLDSHGVQSLTTALNNSSLYSLDLSNTQLDDRDITLLAQAVTNSTMVDLFLHGNEFSTVGLRSLLSALQQSAVTLLDLSKNFITNTGFSVLMVYLKQTAIDTLFLANTMLNTDVFTPYVNTTSLPAMRSLDLSGNVLGDQALFALAAWLRKGGLPLTSLTINAVSATSEGLAALISALPQSLVHLDISYNDFSADAVTALINYLHTSTHILSLSINNIGMSAQQAYHFVSNLNQTTLTDLSMNGNPIGDKAGEVLAQNLVANEQSLLVKSSLTGEEAATLYKGLQPETSLQTVSLEKAELEVGAATALCRVNQYLPNMTVNYFYNALKVMNVANCAFMAANMTNDVVEQYLNHSDLSLEQECKTNQEQEALVIFTAVFMGIFASALALTCCGKKLTTLTSFFSCKKDQASINNDAQDHASYTI